MTTTAVRSVHLSADINVTPMIDILLVLLIIFLVVGPVTSRGLDTLLPQSARNHGGQSEAVVVTISGGPTVHLNREVVALNDLRQRLTSMFRNETDRVLFVRGDADLEFRQIAAVIDIAKGAGMERVALLTDHGDSR